MIHSDKQCLLVLHWGLLMFSQDRVHEATKQWGDIKYLQHHIGVPNCGIMFFNWRRAVPIGWYGNENAGLCRFERHCPATWHSSALQNNRCFCLFVFVLFFFLFVCLFFFLFCFVLFCFFFFSSSAVSLPFEIYWELKSKTWLTECTMPISLFFPSSNCMITQVLHQTPMQGGTIVN